MQLQVDKLGKVAVTVEKDYWNITKDYDKLTIVQAQQEEYKTYISRKPVPAGAELTNRDYWIPFSSLDEQIVLDYNTFVNLWTENLNNVNTNLQRQITSNDEDIAQLNEDLLRKEEDLYTAIASVIAGGVALKQEFGDSEVFGISQKVLTEAIDNIQDQINRLHPVQFGIVLTVNPTIIYNTGDEVTVRVHGATVNGKQASNVILYKKSKTDTDYVQVENVGTTINFSLNVVVSSQTTFKVVCTQDGIQYEDTATVEEVGKYWIGKGNTYSDVYQNNNYLKPISKTPVGTYTIDNLNNDYVFIIIPSTMNINTIKQSGFDVPMQAVDTTTIPNYKIYKTGNTYIADNMIIVVN